MISKKINMGLSIFDTPDEFEEFGMYVETRVGYLPGPAKESVPFPTKLHSHNWIQLIPSYSIEATLFVYRGGKLIDNQELIKLV